MWNKITTQLKNVWEEDVYFLRTMTFGFSWISKRTQKVLTTLKPHTLNLSISSLVFVMGLYVLFPTMVNADIALNQNNPDHATIALTIAAMQNQTRPYGRLELSADAPPRRTFEIPLTAYTSEAAQTDDSPCITASGLDVCERDIENVVAANFLPLGTRVRIPELYGNRVFFVEDRMNERYYYKMDVWMKQKSDAKQFGLKHATVEVF
ncbi:MAG: hypothetical protein AAB431_00010 [Patescibacteria group bacterium]